MIAGVLGSSLGEDQAGVIKLTRVAMVVGKVCCTGLTVLCRLHQGIVACLFTSLSSHAGRG